MASQVRMFVIFAPLLFGTSAAAEKRPELAVHLGPSANICSVAFSPDGRLMAVRALLPYTENRLPEVSQQFRTEAQYPIVDSRGMDFPIAFTKANR